jgi:hypothetical protein
MLWLQAAEYIMIQTKKKRLAIWNWTDLVWTSPNRASRQKQTKCNSQVIEGNIRMDDPQ